MEIGEMLGDSFEYTREGLMGEWKKWILLIICYIIFPLMGGYVVRIYRGARPAPEVDDWVGMFIDGIKLLIIGVVYALPVILVGAVLIGGSVLAFSTGNSAANVAGVGVLLVGMLVVFILAILISLIAVLGMVRFARKDSMGEAFNFSAILEAIGKIGWVEYIVALVVLWIVMVVVQFILGFFMSIPLIGWIIGLFIGPALAIFSARYMTILYESGTPA
ncbi:MAG TPA: DUF4013 domain-containing protein [Methanoculleus sp.]|mgnify:CR=1 FL=1|nr:DUF4013 domain-containing protein [Methanoculleus sp.]